MSSFRTRNKVIFWIGVAIVIILVAVGVAGVLFLKTSDKEEASGENVTVTEEDFARARARASVLGEVVSASKDTIKVTADKKNYSFKVTDDSKITKGISTMEIKTTDLKKGIQVSVLYEKETLNIVNLWWSGK